MTDKTIPWGAPAKSNEEILKDDLSRIERERQETLNFRPTENLPYNFQYDNSLAEQVRSGTLVPDSPQQPGFIIVPLEELGFIVLVTGIGIYYLVQAIRGKQR